VHLGNGKVLKASNFELNPGDNVRIVGETLALGDGTYFAARIVQKGAQAVTVSQHQRLSGHRRLRYERIPEGSPARCAMKRVGLRARFGGGSVERSLRWQ